MTWVVTEHRSQRRSLLAVVMASQSLIVEVDQCPCWTKCLNSGAEATPDGVIRGLEFECWPNLRIQYSHHRPNVRLPAHRRVPSDWHQ